MPPVNQLIAHIELHVNAEVATSDSSQAAGVGRRATYAIAAMDSLKADTRDLSIDAILADISSAAALTVDQTSFRQAITNQRNEGEVRPQLAIQAWVGKAKESRGG